MLLIFSILLTTSHVTTSNNTSLDKLTLIFHAIFSSFGDSTNNTVANNDNVVYSNKTKGIKQARIDFRFNYY